MKGKKVRYKAFLIGRGWKYEFGGEGIIIAETLTAYKIKTSIFNSTWVDKADTEEIS